MIGKQSKDKIVEKVQAQADGMVMLIRIITFLGMWLAFRLALSFVDFMTDVLIDGMICFECIPGFEGACQSLETGVEGAMDCILCCITCPPAFMLWLIVFAIAWIAFRPTVAIPLLIIGCCIGGAMAYSKQQNGGKRGGGGGG